LFVCSILQKVALFLLQVGSFLGLSGQTERRHDRIRGRDLFAADRTAQECKKTGKHRPEVELSVRGKGHVTTSGKKAATFADFR
jgi:hypothetical protein